MIKVVKLTEEQKDLLTGHTYDGEQFFYPTIDSNGNYYISQVERNNCDKPEFQWLKSCELIEHNPVVVNFPF